MSLQSVAKQFVEMCRQGKNFDVMKTLYAPNIVSVEGDGKETAGQGPVIKKSEDWVSDKVFNGETVAGPFYNGANPDQFVVFFTLDITPNITPGGLVQLDVAQTVEDVTGSVTIDQNQQPIVARREFDSNISVHDGGVVVLGGLIKNNRTKSETKVPVLGDLPLLGHLFKQTVWNDGRNELIVLIRPRVLRTADLAQRAAQKLREEYKGLDNIPNDKLPPLPKEPEQPVKKPWYAPVQPPPS